MNKKTTKRNKKRKTKGGKTTKITTYIFKNRLQKLNNLYGKSSKGKLRDLSEAMYVSSGPVSIQEAIDDVDEWLADCILYGLYEKNKDIEVTKRSYEVDIH